jgi:hypothetical protein
MKKIVLVILLSIVIDAECEDWRNPEAKFDTKANKVQKVVITWTPVKNIQKACEKRSREKGLGGFGTPLEACSFWSYGIFENECEILTSNKATMHELGHEMRHCFQGSFHGTPK